MVDIDKNLNDVEEDDDLLSIMDKEDRDNASKNLESTGNESGGSGAGGFSGAIVQQGGVSGIMDLIGNSGNKGSGDLTKDLLDWINGSERLPSDPLVDLLANSTLKIEFGMIFTLLQNFKRMNKIGDFLGDAEEVLFNSDDIPALEPDELKDRIKMASSTIQNLNEINRKTLRDLKSKQSDEEKEKLTMLLSAIPTNKLKELIGSLG